MWKQAFLAEERIESAYREAERTRVAGMVRNTSRTATRDLRHTLLNRVTSYASDVADRVVRVVRPWNPGAGSAA